MCAVCLGMDTVHPEPAVAFELLVPHGVPASGAGGIAKSLVRNRMSGIEFIA